MDPKTEFSPDKPMQELTLKHQSNSELSIVISESSQSNKSSAKDPCEAEIVIDMAALGLTDA
jgi:hypothetical protein